MANAWNIDSRNNPNSLPFAGSKKKITQVNAHEAYRADHHRNLFGTDKQAVFDKNSKTDAWTSSTKSATESGLRDPKGVNGSDVTFLASSQRTTGYTYRGIKNTENELVAKFRKTLADRGIRGVIGMGRSFRIMDDNRSGTLDVQEFWKALCDYRIPISPEECRKLFDLFDTDASGEISYDELMRAVVGELNQIRKEFVTRAFKKADKDNSGILDIADIRGTYNAKMHPDVKSGKKTEDEVLSEFLDTFEAHHALKNPSSKDRKVTLVEFCEYYANVGSTIDDDKYFELMITNAWNLNNASYAKGWGSEI